MSGLQVVEVILPNPPVLICGVDPVGLPVHDETVRQLDEGYELLRQAVTLQVARIRAEESAALAKAVRRAWLLRMWRETRAFLLVAGLLAVVLIVLVAS